MSVVIPLDPGVPFAYQNTDRCTIVGSGAVLADNTDATYVSVTGFGSSPSSTTGLIAAPLPQVDTTNLIRLGLSARAKVSAGTNTSAQVAFYIGDLSTFPTSAQEVAPAFGTTVSDFYLESWQAPSGDTITALNTGTASFVFGLAGIAFGETWSATLYEYAWLLTYSEAPPSGLVQPFRARQRLHPIAPARRWPREAWQGSSPRRVGGYR
jgi:hypothetical protein